MIQHAEQASRPTIGTHYTPGDGDIAECRAIGPTHVVVKWLRASRKRIPIVPREEFAEQYVEVPVDQHEQLQLWNEGW